MRPRVRIGVLAALSVGALTLASVALAAFSARITISGPDASSPAVAVSNDGAGVAVWTRFDGNVSRVQARTVSVGGSLGPVQTLSAAGDSAFNPQVAVDADGDAIVVWTQLEGHVVAHARRISAAGALGPVLDLSGDGDAAAPQVAVDADGDAIAAWYRSNVGTLRVFGRAIPVTGLPGPVLRLSSAAAGASQPQVDVTPSGEGYAAWVGSDGANSRAQGRTISTAGTLGPVRNLSAGGRNATPPTVGVDDFGRAYAAWTRSDGTNTIAQGRSVTQAGVLGTIETLSAAGQNAVLADVAVGPGGNGIVTWTRSDGTFTRIQARTVSTAGGVSPVQTLSAPGHGATVPQVAGGDGGGGVVVWQRHDGSHLRVQARRYSTFGTPQPVQTLSAVGVDAAAPQVADDLSGDAIAVWSAPVGSGEIRIQASRGP